MPQKKTEDTSENVWSVEVVVLGKALRVWIKLTVAFWVNSLCGQFKDMKAMIKTMNNHLSSENPGTGCII